MISHGTAFEILYEATVARQLEMPGESKIEQKWGEYFKLPVMLVKDVADYYGLKTKRIRAAIHSHTSCPRELFESGLLVLRDSALEDAQKQLAVQAGASELILLPPSAVLKLCLFLPATPAVVATIDALWDYTLAEKLNESTPEDWAGTACHRHPIHCDRISDRELAECLAEAKKLNLYPYVQHFGQKECLKAWSSLFAYEGEFPPPQGNFYIKRHTWFDRISDVCLRD